MKQRLEQFLAAENLTRAQFADSINMARAGISHILAGRNNPSYEFIVNTMEAYPALNIEWLLRGRGKMYKNQADLPMDTQRENQSEQNLLFNEVDSPRTLFSEPEALPADDSPSPLRKRRVLNQGKRIVILYDDGTYEEFA